MNHFWDGFDKRASTGAPAAAGLAAGSAAAGGIYSLIRKGLDHPHESGVVAKSLAGLVRKAEGVHPALGPAASLGIPGLGGALTGAAVGKGVAHLQKRFAPKTNKFQQFVRDIGGKIRNHVETWKKRSGNK